ncbi:hypothetical protein GGR53DRAFT_527554 [Hypoxylon sp. FL1150]|nr:hypothetical protein GGR53DRAFT_527554 [Hypoxylon sp. FL1150]
MPPSSANNSHVRLPRSSDEYRRRSKRYSLRIEIMDDDELAEIDRAREAGDRRDRRRAREPSVARSRDDADPDRPRSSERRARRVSTSSTAAVVGRGNPSPSSRPESRQDANRTSARSHDEGAIFPGISERPSSSRVPGPSSSAANNNNRRTRNASTQTLYSGHNRNHNLDGPAPASARHLNDPISWYTAASRPAGRDGSSSLQSAYFDGFLMGQRLAREAQPPQWPPPPPAQNFGVDHHCNQPAWPRRRRSPGFFRRIASWGRKSW